MDLKKDCQQNIVIELREEHDLAIKRMAEDGVTFEDWTIYSLAADYIEELESKLKDS